jgi:hypothetical protein
MNKDYVKAFSIKLGLDYLKLQIFLIEYATWFSYRAKAFMKTRFKYIGGMIPYYRLNLQKEIWADIENGNFQAIMLFALEMAIYRDEYYFESKSLTGLARTKRKVQYPMTHNDAYFWRTDIAIKKSKENEATLKKLTSGLYIVIKNNLTKKEQELVKQATYYYNEMIMTCDYKVRKYKIKVPEFKIKFNNNAKDI